MRASHATILALALMAAAPGCGRNDGQGAGAGGDPPGTGTPMGLELEYALARKVSPGIGDIQGIAIGPEDKLYAVGVGGLAVFDARGGRLAGWETSEPGRAVAVAEDGTIYVALAARIIAFDPKGKILRQWGKTGSGAGEFKLITSLALSGGSLYVADAGNKCVHRYAINGDLVGTLGKRDRAAGEKGFHIPSPHFDVAADAGGRLHVTNPGHQRIEIRNENGDLLGQWGKPGFDFERFCGCCNPTDIALMSGGRTVTSEKGIPRVKVYDPDGRMLAYISPDHFPENAAGLDLAADSAGRIYVAEPVKSAVFVFERKE